MSAIRYVRNAVIPAIYELLPHTMESPESRAMLVCIGLQESRFEHRRQVGGPALSFWQMEAGGGVRGVLRHPATRPYITPILKTMLYEDDESECHAALLDNDILAAVFARLLLYSDPKPLPKADEPNVGWEYYRRTWRPGKPHPKTWRQYWDQSWTLV